MSNLNFIHQTLIIIRRAFLCVFEILYSSIETTSYKFTTKNKCFITHGQTRQSFENIPKKIAYYIIHMTLPCEY